MVTFAVPADSQSDTSVLNTWTTYYKWQLTVIDICSTLLKTLLHKKQIMLQSYVLIVLYPPCYVPIFVLSIWFSFFNIFWLIVTHFCAILSIKSM